jgi:predicted signal transduction protein with EAL and GGDEF domain
LANDITDDVIVRSTIELAHNLGLTVVAEGVETEATQHHLAELGCDIAQGYLISRPIPHLDFLFWAAEHHPLTAPDPNTAQAALRSERTHNVFPESDGSQILLQKSTAQRPLP